LIEKIYSTALVICVKSFLPILQDLDENFDESLGPPPKKKKKIRPPISINTTPGDDSR